MILDNAGNIIDFVAWGWTDAEIQTLSVNVNGFQVTIGPEWSGNAAVACPAPGSVSRTGTGDNNYSGDFACETETKGTQNSNLSSAFNDCGVGLCGSIPVPVDVNLVPGITVTLPNDTIIQTPFSFVIDAGAGYSSYLWSTSETTQSITVTSGGTYWVTVTGGPNGCSATDTILINSTVSVAGLLNNEDTYVVFPNPASRQFVVTGNAIFGAETEVILVDCSGRKISTGSLLENKYGVYFDVSGIAPGIYMLKIRNEALQITRKLIIQH